MSTLTKLDSPTFFSQKTVNGTLIFTSLDYILFRPFKDAKRAPPDKKKASHFCKALVIRWDYITREDMFINNKTSLQHSNYVTTSKHYVDKCEVAKQMVKNGFRVFDKKGYKW